MSRAPRERAAQCTMGTGTQTEVAATGRRPRVPVASGAYRGLIDLNGSIPRMGRAAHRSAEADSRSCVRISPDGPDQGASGESESNLPMRARGEGERGGRVRGSQRDGFDSHSGRDFLSRHRDGRTRPRWRGGPRPAVWASRRRRKQVSGPGGTATLAWDPSPRQSTFRAWSYVVRRSSVAGDGHGAMTQSGNRHGISGRFSGKVFVSSSSAGPAREGPQTLPAAVVGAISRAVRRRSCPQRASGWHDPLRKSMPCRARPIRGSQPATSLCQRL